MNKNNIIKAVALVIVVLAMFFLSLPKLSDNKNFKVIFNSLESKADSTIVNT